LHNWSWLSGCFSFCLFNRNCFGFRCFNGSCLSFRCFDGSYLSFRCFDGSCFSFGCFQLNWYWSRLGRFIDHDIFNRRFGCCNHAARNLFWLLLSRLDLWNRLCFGKLSDWRWSKNLLDLGLLTVVRAILVLGRIEVLWICEVVLD